MRSTRRNNTEHYLWSGDCRTQWNMVNRSCRTPDLIHSYWERGRRQPPESEHRVPSFARVSKVSQQAPGIIFRPTFSNIPTIFPGSPVQIWRFFKIFKNLFFKADLYRLLLKDQQTPYFSDQHVEISSHNFFRTSIQLMKVSTIFGPNFSKILTNFPESTVETGQFFDFS